MSIARKLAELREQFGMTQQDLATAAGVAQATISRIERGVLPQPKLDVLRRLAEALHVTVDYLADRTEEMSPSDVVSADPRAQAIFRGYQDLSEEQKTALIGFVRYLQEERKKTQRERGS
jgi:transcriptional regulator with XRE-family HTH domain